MKSKLGHSLCINKQGELYPPRDDKFRICMNMSTLCVHITYTSGVTYVQPFDVKLK